MSGLRADFHKYPNINLRAGINQISGLSPQLFGRRKPQENDTHSFFDLWCVRWCRQQDYLKDIKHWQKRCHVDSIDNSNSNQVSINFSISYSHTVNLTMLIVNTILTWFWHNVGSVQNTVLWQFCFNLKHSDNNWQYLKSANYSLIIKLGSKSCESIANYFFGRDDVVVNSRNQRSYLDSQVAIGILGKQKLGCGNLHWQ